MAKATVMQIVIAMALISYVHGGMVKFQFGKMNLRCEGDTLEKFERVNRTVSEIVVRRCPPPKETYAAVFRSLGLDVAAIRHLKLYHIPEEPNELHEPHFIGLSLSSLLIASRQISYQLSAFKGKINLAEGDNVMLTCMYEETLADMPEVLPSRIVRVSKVEVQRCPLPQNSYDATLRAVGINVTVVSQLKLSLPRSNDKLCASHFVNIFLQVLTISWPDGDRELFDVQILVLLAPYLKKFSVANTRLQSLPKTRLVKVSLSNGESLSEWGDCNNLRKLDLSNWKVSKDKWLAQCGQLKELRLGQLQAQWLQHTLAGVATLTKLHVLSCKLTFLTNDLLSNAVHLLELELADNAIIQIHKDAFNELIKLQTLQIISSDLHDSQDLAAALKPLKALHTLEIKKNSLLDFCSEKMASLTLPFVRLSLRQTGVTDLCFGQWNTLEYLDLRDCEISNLKLNGFMLPSPRDHPLLVDLRSNKMRHLPATKEDSDLMISDFNQAANITILVSLSLDCDCRQAWFARALRSLSGLKIVGARCSSGEALDDPNPEFIKRLECKKTVCKGCVCRRSWYNNETVADCSGRGMIVVPPLHIPNLRALIASDNMINTLRADIFIPTLLVVDFSGNYISRINAEVVEAMFREPKRNVSLSRNPLICNCDNEPLLTALQAHHDQVVDYDNMTCADNALKICDVDVNALCKEERDRRLLVGAAIGGSLLAAASFAFIFCYRYWRELKVYLFARGWCMCCIQELELDADRLYDAFISFAHGDDQFVTENLLPELEHDYSLCVHTRDWTPGELITTQVFRSVEQSRRTVIILSRNFVSSRWGMMEFRTANTRAISEGRARVIAIVLDDIVEDEQLHPDLCRYLRTNTYLKWGDPWFWQKLRYALPHQPQSSTLTSPLELSTLPASSLSPANPVANNSVAPLNRQNKKNVTGLHGVSEIPK